MAFSIQSNPMSTGSSYWWMSSGIPFVLPSVGSNGSWDGSKWVQTSPSDTTTINSSNIYLSDGSSSFGTPTTSTGFSNTSSGAVNGFSLSSPGFAGSFSDSAVAGIGQQGALSGMTNSAISSIGNAALSGAIAGGLTGSISNGISTAVAGIANPGSMAGLLGGAINGALGLSTSPAIGVISGLASLASPALGAAIGVFGPAISDLAMDALDARENEQTRDWAEDLAGSYVGGRISGNHLSNALDNRGMQLGYQSVMGPVSTALGQLGITNTGLTQEALSAAYQDLGFTPEVAVVSALADVVGQNVSDITSDYGVGFGSQQAGAGLGMGNPTGDFGWGGVVDAALSDTVSGLGLSAGFGQVDTTTQGPSPASTSIGKGISDQASAAGMSNASNSTGPSGPGTTEGSPSGATEGATSDDSSSNSSNEGGGDGGSDTGDTGNSEGTGNTDSGEGSDSGDSGDDD